MGAEATTRPGVTAPRADPFWARLERTGGIAGLVFVVMVLVALVLMVVAPVPPAEGGPLLAYVAGHKGVYLTELICFVGLSVPAMVVFVAVARALMGSDRSIALIGGILGVAAETVALAVGSSPQSLHGGLVILSNSYAAAESDAERASLVSAADALIAATNGAPWAGVLTAAAILVLSALMRQGDFGRTLAVVGMITGALGIVSEAFRTVIGPAYLLYGLLLPLWFALVGRRLFTWGRKGTSSFPDATG